MVKIHTFVTRYTMGHAYKYTEKNRYKITFWYKTQSNIKSAVCLLSLLNECSYYILSCPTYSKRYALLAYYNGILVPFIWHTWAQCTSTDDPVFTCTSHMTYLGTMHQHWWPGVYLYHTWAQCTSTDDPVFTCTIHMTYLGTMHQHGWPGVSRRFNEEYTLLDMFWAQILAYIDNTTKMQF
jgi:hypothetical protein